MVGGRAVSGGFQQNRAPPGSGDAVSFQEDRKSTRLNFSHANISYAVFCLKKNLQGPPSTYHSTTYACTRTGPASFAPRHYQPAHTASVSASCTLSHLMPPHVAPRSHVTSI